MGKGQGFCYAAARHSTEEKIVTDDIDEGTIRSVFRTLHAPGSPTRNLANAHRRDPSETPQPEQLSPHLFQDAMAAAEARGATGAIQPGDDEDFLTEFERQLDAWSAQQDWP